MKTETEHVFRLADYRPTDFEITSVALTFRLDATDTLVTNRLSVARREGAAKNAPLVLDGDELTLVELTINGQLATTDQYSTDPNRMEINGLPSNDPFLLEIKTRISPEANTKLMGLYRSNNIYCTQCEAEGFRRISYFLDRPDVLSVYTTRLEARVSEAPLLLSNGNPVDAGALDDGWHFAEWHDPHPKPSYLFALVAGDLGVVEQAFTTLSGKPVDLKVFVEHGKEPLAAYAMDALVRSMQWDEQTYGREYDLDVFMIVAVSDFNMGAMENKGLNIFNDKFVLADPDTATDADYANIEAIIAHEYFHNWTGNRITCRDWFQLCLKEGLTVYRDHEFSADMRSRPVKRIAEVRLLKAHQFPEDSGPLAHPVRPVRYSEINNFYTATVYEKGSEVVRMLATILGKDFQKGLDLYFDRHDGDAATVEDFLACFEEAAAIDLSQFSNWYHQAGTPAVTVTARHDYKSKSLIVQLEQSIPPTPGQNKKNLMHIPLRVGLFDEAGSEISPSSVTGIDVTGDVLHLNKRHHEVVFSGLQDNAILSVNRSFSAPVNIHFQQSSSDLAHLALHESEPYSRWQAANSLALRVLIEATQCVQAGSTVSPDSILVECLVASLSDKSLEPALRAQILSLPSEADIAREIGSDIDPDAIHVARNGVIGSIAVAGRAAFDLIAEANSPNRPFAPDAEGAGQRALYLAALLYCARSRTSPESTLTAHRNADNMTMLSGTLAILTREFPDEAETRSTLKDFERRFRDNPLVIDKWLAVQATVPGSGTLKNVITLMESAHYTASNPNRVRALIGSFVTGNPTGFNDREGNGYAFLAQQVTELDKSNPQIAARLLTAMRSWRSLESVRREKARAALDTIAAQDSLSTDVRDIAERTLG